MGYCRLFLSFCNPGSFFFFQYSGDRNQLGVGEVGGGWDAFVGCLMAVYTYMKLHILAESGPEKKYLAFAVWSM